MREPLTLVEDVVERDHRAPFHVRARSPLPRDAAAMVPGAVAGDVHVVEFEREIQAREQLAAVHDRPAHHAQPQRKYMLVAVAETRIQFGRHLVDGAQ